jgi:GNAT superfamily N-acetyltransferase
MEIDQESINKFVYFLKKTKYANAIQDLSLEYCTDSHGGYIQLLLIQMKARMRNKGWGSAVMSDIIKFADEHNVRVKLWITDVYGSDLKRLKAFYKRNGFRSIPNSNMIYHPQKTSKKIVTI